AAKYRFVWIDLKGCKWIKPCQYAPEGESKCINKRGGNSLACETHLNRDNMDALYPYGPFWRFDCGGIKLNISCPHYNPYGMSLLPHALTGPFAQPIEVSMDTIGNFTGIGEMVGCAEQGLWHKSMVDTFM